MRGTHHEFEDRTDFQGILRSPGSGLLRGKEAKWELLVMGGIGRKGGRKEGRNSQEEFNPREKKGEWLLNTFYSQKELNIKPDYEKKQNKQNPQIVMPSAYGGISPDDDDPQHTIKTPANPSDRLWKTLMHSLKEEAST